jgi:hypothetical protein
VPSPKLTVEYVVVDSLTPYAGNARRHSRRQVQQIARSIERFGFTNGLAFFSSEKTPAVSNSAETAGRELNGCILCNCVLEQTPNTSRGGGRSSEALEGHQWLNVN